MKSSEIDKELLLIQTYDDLVAYLLNKYGGVPHDYFINKSCKSKNVKNSRSNEGLYIHHIDENKAINLSKTKYATKCPFEYQKANRLVYCNILEHLILHIQIYAENPKENLGLRGIFTFMVPQINDYFSGYEFKQEYLIKSFDLIKENYDDYIFILQTLVKYIKTLNKQFYKQNEKQIKQKLSSNSSCQIIKEIYKKL